MLEKIVSGGQTGADQGALDAAIKCGMPHGGWIPRGRKTENGTLPPVYQLKEMVSGKYHKRTRQNVADSDGTVIFFHGKLSGGSKYTEKLAVKLKKPFLSLNLSEMPAFQTVIQISSWILKHHIGVLNVAGSRASKDSRIHAAVKFIISCIILLETFEHPSKTIMEKDNCHIKEDQIPFPKTLDGAVNRIVSELPHIDKVVIANMELEDLDPVHTALGGFIRHQFGLNKDNMPLIESCRDEAAGEDIDVANVPTIIIHSVWEKLRTKDSYRLLR